MSSRKTPNNLTIPIPNNNNNNSVNAQQQQANQINFNPLNQQMSSMNLNVNNNTNLIQLQQSQIAHQMQPHYQQQLHQLQNIQSHSANNNNNVQQIQIVQPSQLSPLSQQAHQHLQQLQETQQLAALQTAAIRAQNTGNNEQQQMQQAQQQQNTFNNAAAANVNNNAQTALVQQHYLQQLQRVTQIFTASEQQCANDINQQRVTQIVFNAISQITVQLQTTQAQLHYIVQQLTPSTNQNTQQIETHYRAVSSEYDHHYRQYLLYLQQIKELQTYLQHHQQQRAAQQLQQLNQQRAAQRIQPQILQVQQLQTQHQQQQQQQQVAVQYEYDHMAGNAATDFNVFQNRTEYEWRKDSKEGNHGNVAVISDDASQGKTHQYLDKIGYNDCYL